MNIVGYSGLDAAVRHARTAPDLRPGEERMVQGLDSAAALLINGKVVAAAAEERFTFEKHTGAFPRQAILYCLDAAGLKPSDIDFVAHGFDYSRFGGYFSDRKRYETVLDPARQIELWREGLHPRLSAERLIPTPHHLAHAASAYFPSGFGEALCLVCDGMGEVESMTLYAAREGRFNALDRIPMKDSLGILYGIVTAHLGFKFNADEYKVMGLAPYGDPERFRPFFESITELREHGRYELTWGRLANDRKPHYRGLLAHLDAHVVAKSDGGETPSRIHCDFAAAAQACLERVLFHTLSYWREQTGLDKLCMAGGVALNCTFNGKLIQSRLFDHVYIQPASGDDGTALGAALLAARRAGEAPPALGELPFYGPDPSPDQIKAVLPAPGEGIDTVDLGDEAEAAADAARALVRGEIVAWFQGRMEFGPRALGHRSILANPLLPDIKERLNAITKLREGFRPFAPAATRERAADYFDFLPSPAFDVMLAVCPVRAEWRQRLPGITHVDGSARLQTVDADRNGLFHHLITCFGRLSGVHCVVNTSFNLNGQPIIASPAVAVDTFRRARIDRLYLGRWRLSKEPAGARRAGTESALLG